MNTGKKWIVAGWVLLAFSGPAALVAFAIGTYLVLSEDDEDHGEPVPSLLGAAA